MVMGLAEGLARVVCEWIAELEPAVPYVTAN
jgi:hypothetical protein